MTSETEKLIERLTEAKALLRRCRTYVGNPSTHPTLQHTTGSVLARDLDVLLRTLETSHDQ